MVGLNGGAPTAKRALALTPGCQTSSAHLRLQARTSVRFLRQTGIYPAFPWLQPNQTPIHVMFEAAISGLNDILQRHRWVEELAAILPLSALIDFIDVPKKLHTFEMDPRS
jgi:hypothetical protein